MNWSSFIALLSIVSIPGANCEHTHKGIGVISMYVDNGHDLYSSTDTQVSTKTYDIITCNLHRQQYIV